MKDQWTLSIFTNAAPEVIAAYIAAGASIILAVFAFIAKGKERKRNQTTEKELEEFKQRLELHNAFKKQQIEFIGKLLNHVYNIRVLVIDCIDCDDQLLAVPPLMSATQQFLEFYRSNADKINDLEGDVRDYGHDVMRHFGPLKAIYYKLTTHTVDAAVRTKLAEALPKVLSGYKECIIGYETF